MSRDTGQRSRKRTAAKAQKKATGALRPVSNLRRAGDLAALALVAAHASLLLLMHQAGLLPGWLATTFAALSLATMLAYAHDKRAAQREQRRTPEATLHLFELFGGWPGALLAQRWLRHKNRKRSYQLAFWVCVLAHEALLLAIWKMA